MTGPKFQLFLTKTYLYITKGILCVIEVAYFVGNSVRVKNKLTIFIPQKDGRR